MKYFKGGWMEYITFIKIDKNRPLAKAEYAKAMEGYGKGIKWQDIALELPLETPPEPVEKRKRFT